MTQVALLPSRGIVKLTGPDRASFLNGLVSNDVLKAAPGQLVWAALLTPQGRYLVDFFIFSDGDCLLLDLPRLEIPALIAKLRRFRLRAQVDIEEATEEFNVYAIWQGDPPATPLTGLDPRLAEAGYRCLSSQSYGISATIHDYAAHRISLGLPDGPPDLEPEKTLLLEAGFDELNGIDWKKGCYMGQELTARTKYRGLVKRKLFPVTLSQPDIPAGTPVLADGHEVGSLRSVEGVNGLAMLQLSALAQPLTASGAFLSVRIPHWMNQKEPHPAG